jgi:hypothetical protein
LAYTFGVANPSGNDDHLGPVLTAGVADQVLDAGEVPLDRPKLESGLDDRDPRHAETSAAEVLAGSGPGADLALGDASVARSDAA